MSPHAPVLDATIYDVAAKAGVSIATVSRVLNAPSQVHEATRTRVLAAIDSLQFVPRAEATARARKTTGRIGVLAPFFTYPSFVQRLRGVAAALADSPYELVIYNIDTAHRRDAYLASLPVARRLDGLIVMSLPLAEPVLARLISNAMAIALIEITHPELSSVEIDDACGGQMAAEYLLTRGHRCIGFVGDSEVPSYALATSQHRLAGFQAALARAGAPLCTDYIVLGPHGLESARAQAHRLLSLPKPPTAIFAPSDTQAMGVLKAARERNLRVPEDLAVIGFDDVDTAEYIGLTTIRQPLDESGRRAVDLLFARLDQRDQRPQRVQLPLTLVPRETA